MTPVDPHVLDFLQVGGPVLATIVSVVGLALIVNKWILAPARQSDREISANQAAQAASVADASRANAAVSADLRRTAELFSASLADLQEIAADLRRDRRAIVSPPRPRRSPSDPD